jgi:acetoin utilization deacetylase AcuC-like enzyme
MTNAVPNLYTSPYSKKHDTGNDHPENTKRIEILERLFTEKPFKDWPQTISHPATLDQILYAHDEDYVFDLQDRVPEHGLASIDGDTILCPDSYDAALYAVGAVCQAVDDVCKDQNHSSTDLPSCSRPPAYEHDCHKNAQRAFCSIRPPGHHAEPNTAFGFCLFNNIFIAARHAQIVHDIQKIAIVDFDVHHGNGTETMTRRHNNTHTGAPILYISSHGYPLFPMSGDPAQNDNTTLNIRLPGGCNSAQFRALYEDKVFPKLNDFAPNLIMLSSGFDAHKNDPLAPINLETDDYTWLTERLCSIADQHCQGRIISVLEGGYDLESLKDCVTAHLKALAFTCMASSYTP